IDPNDPYGRIMAEIFARNKLDYDITIRARFGTTVCALVKAGLGIAVIDQFTVAHGGYPGIELLKIVEPTRFDTYIAVKRGAPLAHSASPAMHERAAEALGAHCHYQLIEVAGAGREELRLLLDGVRRLGLAGVNVTFPYKEAVVSLLDELSPGAQAIGAVNTVVVREGRLIGYNTDTTGF